MAWCARALKSALAEPETPVIRSELRARWIILAILCGGLFGSYYAYDIPAASENALLLYWNESINSTTTSSTGSFSFKFNLLYSLYSWPNVILPFLGGVISDKLGVRLMGVVFMGLIFLGQIITSVGVSMEDETMAWWIMWTGRTVFGLGGESLSVVQSAFVAQYFQGKELAFALGVNLALARVGSVINDVVSAVLTPVYMAYWVGSAVCGASVLAMIYAYHVDLTAEARLRKNRGLRPLVGQGLLSRLFCGCRGKPSEGASLLSDDADGESGGEGKVFGDEPPKEEVHMTAVLHFPLVFWLLTLSCVTVYICVLTFNNNCASFVAQKWLTDKPLSQLSGDDAQALYLKANTVMLTTYLVAGFLTPFLGGLIDNIGMRAIFCLVAAVAIAGLHAVLGLTTVYPVAPLLMLGVCYSIYAAALWPSIALVIPPENQATAYGVVSSVQNLGLAVSPNIVAYFMPDPNCPTYDECVAGWNRTELFFVACGAAGVLCGCLLNIADHWSAQGALLNGGKVGPCRRREAGDGARKLMGEGPLTEE